MKARSAQRQKTKVFTSVQAFVRPDAGEGTRTRDKRNISNGVCESQGRIAILCTTNVPNVDMRFTYSTTSRKVGILKLPASNRFSSQSFGAFLARWLENSSCNLQGPFWLELEPVRSTIH
ncbi:hypothetical protein PoB_001702300 [Plakobranchus ocellatus]|uniref:Uncharacterized protein n=1 Tax=Plakobranchus ocellatus TaxID=259542 RepID=A0AAV3Z7U2_9GAST|nr:hypothetical protein PoB_001702300 [Plakobranchus ocellatus]